MKTGKFTAIVLSALVCAGLFIGAGTGGGAIDPLVTKSWVDDYVETSFLKIEKQVATLSAGIASGNVGTKQELVRLWIGKTTAQIGEKSVAIDVAPVIKDGRTMVPLAFVSQALGASVNWDHTIKEVSFKKGETKVRMIVGEKAATINQEKQEMDVAVYIENGRTMVPLAFISNALAAKAQWYGDTKMIVIQ